MSKRVVVKVTNQEIDYDKLAEAIVKANNKQQESYSPSREWMKYVLIPVFVGLAIISGTLSIAMFVTLFKSASVIFENSILTGIIIFLLEFFIAFFALGFCAFSIVSVKEIDKENDRGYIASMFSNIVAISALIVSLVALLKGVT